MPVAFMDLTVPLACHCDFPSVVTPQEFVLRFPGFPAGVVSRRIQHAAGEQGDELMHVQFP